MPNWENRRIFVVSGSLTTIGGGGFSPYLLARRLARHGADVTVFTHHVHDLPPHASGANGFTMKRPVLRYGCRWFIPDRLLIHQVNRAISREKPDLVINVGVTLLTRLLLQGPHAGSVAVWENIDACPENRLIDAEAARLMPRCRFMLSPAPRVDSLIRSGYGFEGRIKRLPFWVEEEPPCGECRDELRSDFLILARRDMDKGFAAAFEALSRLKEEGIKPKMLVAGPGPDEDVLQEAVRWNVRDQIRLDMFRDRQRIMDALASTRCLVLPSRSEGYPLVMLEALSQGTPIVGTDTGGVADLLGETLGTRVISIGDVPSLVDALRDAWRRFRNGLSDDIRQALKQRFCSLNAPAAINGNLQAILDD